MELIRTANPLGNRKKKYSRRHFEQYRSAGWAQATTGGESFPAHEATVMDVMGVPNCPNNLLSISGDTTVRYIASMDDEHIRIWGADDIGPSNEKSAPNSNMEYMRPYELTEAEKATLLVNRMRINRDQLDAMAPPLSTATPSRKRKEPFASPIKRLKTPTKSSPVSKMMKLASPVLPLTNITNATPETPGLCDGKTPVSQRRRYPTENLPNRIYEQFVAKFKARRLAERGKSSSPQVAQPPPSSSKKKMEDFYTRGGEEQIVSSKLGRTRLPSVTEFGDSVCSKMLSEQDRAIQNSPRKLMVKLTPLKSRPLTQAKEPPSSHRRSSRNLLDYFSKK
ncbi:hypothetical protein OESDEN_07781 [Oesophagostomum dentatum]|uniref:WD domain, G-beta repeat protein n=1 Tax=Oesophagostomum dentatum TaxID=61180 RepID=A0A0B1T942_OESDE|nr:hypothetical protein OESDEN_07781 [Oesophagostomum dentatum]